VVKGKHKAYQLRFVAACLGPILAIYGILRVWPILQAVYLSFTNKNLFKRRVDFIGLQHYLTLLTHDADFAISLKNTLLFACLTAVAALLLALIIAMVMYRRDIFGTGAVQSLLFIPVVISVVPCAMIWKWIYDPQYGILNYVLSFFGAPSVGWLVDKRFSPYSVIAFAVWKWLGYYMIIFWVGLKALPRTYLEAAEIDGAGEMSLIRRILLPLLRPIILFATVVATINGFTIFSEVYVMTVGSQAAPGNIVKVLTYDIYERSFLYGKVGEANAEAVFLFLLLLVFTVAQVRLNRSRGAR
jgi:multiple sugar transport system permease protein